MSRFKMVKQETILEGPANFVPKSDAGNIHMVLVKKVEDEELTFLPVKAMVPGYSVWKRIEHIGVAK